MSTNNRTNIPNSLNEYWMPFTSNKDFKKNPRLITEAKGCYLKNHEGQTMIDASSGLFCNPLGHGRKEITEAVSKQLEKLIEENQWKSYNDDSDNNIKLLFNAEDIEENSNNIIRIYKFNRE